MSRQYLQEVQELNFSKATLTCLGQAIVISWIKASTRF